MAFTGASINQSSHTARPKNYVHVGQPKLKEYLVVVQAGLLKSELEI